MVATLPLDDCPMPDWLQTSYRNIPPEIEAAIDPILIKHRDRIFREHIGLPLVF
jgi:hypothetical protein